jgi:hypothetical protein
MLVTARRLLLLKLSDVAAPVFQTWHLDHELLPSPPHMRAARE